MGKGGKVGCINDGGILREGEVLNRDDDEGLIGVFVVIVVVVCVCVCVEEGNVLDRGFVGTLWI